MVYDPISQKDSDKNTLSIQLNISPTDRVIFIIDFIKYLPGYINWKI